MKRQLTLADSFRKKTKSDESSVREAEEGSNSTAPNDIPELPIEESSAQSDIPELPGEEPAQREGGQDNQDRQNSTHSNDECASRNCRGLSPAEQKRLSKLTDRFQHTWLQDRSLTFCEKTQTWWLKYVEGEGMFCVLCQKHDTKNVTNHQKKWNTDASVRFKRSQVELHGKSQQHQNAIAAELSQRFSFFHHEATKREEKKDEILHNAFLCAYWLAKQEISNRKLPFLLDLLQMSGLDSMKYFKHRSARSVQEFFLLLGQAVQEDVLHAVHSSNSFGLLADEVTDIGIKEQLLVFIQYVDKNTTVQTKFLAVKDVLENFSAPNAESLHTVITDTVKESKLEESKFTSFVSDGASVMTGRKSGVATRLKQSTNPKMMNIHCICHRLALACADSSDEVSYIKTIEDMLIAAWKFFENSPKRSAAYVKTQQQIHDVVLSQPASKVVAKKIKKATRTRWLSLNNAISGIYQDYLPLLLTFRALSEDPMAVGLLKRFGSAKFLGTVYMLHEVLPCLASLSKAFQKGNVHFASIASSLEYTLDTLDGLEKKKTFISVLKADLLATGRLGLSGIELSPSLEEELGKQFTSYIKALSTNINNRFGDAAPLLSAFRIFDPLMIPDRSEPDFSDYGKSDCVKLAEHFFSSPEDQMEALEEWGKFKYELLRWKSEMPQSLSQINDQSGEKAEKNLIKETPTEWAIKRLMRSKSAYGPVYHKLLHLADICLSTPVSNAWPERGASALKRIKTRVRNPLKNNMLQALLHISINGPPVQECEVIVSAALKRWREKSRRNLPPKSARTTGPNLSSNSSSDEIDAEVSSALQCFQTGVESDSHECSSSDSDSD